MPGGPALLTGARVALAIIAVCLGGAACVVRTDQSVPLTTLRPLRDDVTEATRIAAAWSAGVTTQFDRPGGRFRGDTLHGLVNGSPRAIPKSGMEGFVILRDTVDFDHVVKMVQRDGTILLFQPPGAVLVRDSLFGIAASIERAVSTSDVEAVWVRRVDEGKSTAATVGYLAGMGALAVLMVVGLISLAGSAY